MKIGMQLLLACVAFTMAAQAERLHTNRPASGTPESAVSQRKPKRLKWLRKIGSGEVGLAMKLSAIGIEKFTVPPPAAKEW